jgi:hypothetical protein
MAAKVMTQDDVRRREPETFRPGRGNGPFRASAVMTDTVGPAPAPIVPVTQDPPSSAKKNHRRGRFRAIAACAFHDDITGIAVLGNQVKFIN